MKKFLLLLLFFFPFIYFTQIRILVVDTKGKAVSDANINYNQQTYKSNENGEVQVPLAETEMPIQVEKVGYFSFQKRLKNTPKVQNLSVLLKVQKSSETKEIEEVVFQGKAKNKISDLTSIEISRDQAKSISSLTGGIEDLLKTLPYVNSNAELSSQYMVRGGNYDENLTYINGIEIYRPLLIRNSMQEGMSIINPDMVQNINFSAGGFEARYGDKMSSVLNIYYRNPTKNEVSGEASLIGGRLGFGVVSKNKKFNSLVSARYRNTNLVLKTLNEQTDFNPIYKDLQVNMNYDFNPKWSLSFIGYASDNQYDMIPKRKDIDFGSLLQPIRLSVFYAGRENDSYRNYMGTASINFKPNKRWLFTLDNFAYSNREREYYTIASGYLLQAFDPQTGDPIVTYDAGGQIEQARNDLNIKLIGSHFKTKFTQNLNTNYEMGVKWENEYIQDNTNEWKLKDSVGYSVPRDYTHPGTLDASSLELDYHIKGLNSIVTQRLSSYAQMSHKFLWNENKLFFNAGVRSQYWSFNNQTIVSPRIQFAIKPNWQQTDMLFRFSTGVYYQSPFYKEIKDLEGDFNPNIKAQKSYHFILANDYEFLFRKRNFKLTTEAYYKAMSNLIPYYIDNVRIRYTGKNNSEGYAYGIDTRLNGEFVPGIDSWVSASYARIFENIDGQGFIARPTDQRLRFSMFYQDYMPKFPTMRVNLSFVYAMGLPNGAPLLSNPYDYQRRLPSYKRVDIGLSKVFIDRKDKRPREGSFWAKFDEVNLGVQIFNALNISNVVSNQWISDVNSDLNVAAPVRLTGRFFNVRLQFKL